MCDLTEQNVQELLEYILTGRMFSCSPTDAVTGFFFNFSAFSLKTNNSNAGAEIFYRWHVSVQLFLLLISVAVIDETCFCLGAHVSRGLSYKTALKTDVRPLSHSHSSPNIPSPQLPPGRSTKPQTMYAELCVQ